MSAGSAAERRDPRGASVDPVQHLEHVVVTRLSQGLLRSVVVAEQSGGDAGRLGDRPDRRTVVSLAGEVLEGRFADPARAVQVLERHGPLVDREVPQQSTGLLARSVMLPAGPVA